MVEITEITQEAKITDLVAPLDTVVSETTDKTLSSVLPSVTSSHSGVFVYDGDGKFAGLVSPHKALYSSSYPGSTSVETVLFVPPTITPDTTIYEAVSHMLATRIYSLPVFGSDEQPTGVIHADDILEHIAADSEAMKALSNRIEPNEPITANINSTAGEVHQMLKDEGISRLLLVDDTGKLEGIVTRSDLANLLVAPSMKRRFPSEGSEGGLHSRGGEKEYREDHPVRRYAVTLVNTLPAGTRANKLVSHLIESDHRSVVLVDRQQRPTGFLSVRDLLEAAAPTAVPEEVPITMSVPEEDIEQRQLRVAEKHLERFWQKMKRRTDLERVAVNAKGIKNPQNQTKQFEVTVRAIPVTGEQFVASTEGWEFLDALQSATTIVEKQIRRKTLHG